MRIRRPVAVLALVASACSSSPDVVVSRGGDASGDAPEATPAAAEPVEAFDAGLRDLRSLLLTADDVPQLAYSGPMSVPGEPTFETIDCPLANDVWAAAARPGERSRGHSDELDITFRNTAVSMDDAEHAARTMEAARTVWEFCPSFADDHGAWWAEPLPTAPSTAAASDWSSAGLMLGSGRSSGSAIDGMPAPLSVGP